MAPLDLTTNLGPAILRSPLIAASGTVGSVVEWSTVADVRPYGAAVAKSVAVVPWPGRPTPRVAPAGPGMLNGIGIQNAGIEAWKIEVGPNIAGLEVPVWGSAVGEAPIDYATVASGLVDAGVEVVEVNLSCPNLDGGKMFALDASLSADVISAVRDSVRVPIGAKLSPNSEDIVSVARACISAGADFLTLTNTALGFGVDIETASPLLSGGIGGYSGPGLKAISLRCVYEVASAVPGAPIVGCGGIRSGEDVIEYLMAGASAVAIGTVHMAEPRAGRRILKETEKMMKHLGYHSVGEVVGRAV